MPQKQEIWADLHPDFNKNSGWIITDTKKKLTYQELWQRWGISYEEAKEWIAIGLEPEHDNHLVDWLKKEGYQSAQVKDNLFPLKLLRWQITIHSDFTKELRQEWIKWFGLNEEKYENWAYRTAKDWIAVGLAIQQAKLAKWLENRDYIAQEERRKKNHQGEINEWGKKQKLFLPEQKAALEQEYEQDTWASTIHPDFAKKNWSKICQQCWEEVGLTYQEAQEWISLGFEPSEYDKVKQWKDQSFTFQQCQSWKQAGLRNGEAQEAFYLKRQNITPADLARKLKGRRDAQGWVDVFYPLETKKIITKFELGQKELTGSLIIDDWESLKAIDCIGNQLIKLTITNCPELTTIIANGNRLVSCEVSDCENLLNFYCSNNQLATLILPTIAKNLIGIDVGNNKLIDLSVFSHLVNLKEINLMRNPLSSGNLEPLKNLRKLEYLLIDNTNLAETWEHLLKLDKIILNTSGYYSNIKPRQELVRYTETEEERKKRKYDLSKDTYDLQVWRTKQTGYQNLQKTLFKINPNLNIQDVINQFEFFNVKTGEFQGDLNNLIFLLEKSNEDKYFLRKTIENLTNLIKTQKNKIVEAYTYFTSEKETLQELIKIHLEYSKTKQQKQNKEAVKLRKQRDKIRDELEKKLNEEQIAEIEGVFNDCDELVHAELELEAKANIPLSIEFTKEGNFNITYIGSVNVQQGNAVIGCQFQDNTNLSHNTRIEELTSEFQAYTLQPPKSN